MSERNRLRDQVAWLVAVLIASGAAYPVFAHPKPGAHADVRFTIDADAVRCTVIMNVLFVDQIVNTTRESRDRVSDPEVAGMRSAVEEYFGGSRTGIMTALVDRPNRVNIDGIDVAPVVRTLKVIRPPPETRPGFIQNPALLLPQVFAEVEYPCKSSPKVVSIVWGAFPRDFIAQDRDLAPISDVETVLIADGRLELVTFRKTEPEYTWHAPAARVDVLADIPIVVKQSGMRISVVSVLIGLCWVGWAGWLAGRAVSARLKCVAAVAGSAAFAAVAAAVIPFWTFRVGAPFMGQNPPALHEAEARAVFVPLHANIYRAFDYAREGDIYEALAGSVDGPLLDATYNDVYRGLIMQEEGGALSRVSSVTPIETRLLEPPPIEPGAFVIFSRWRVEGIVYHWGHSHTRTNEYAAEYTVAIRAPGWRIVGTRPLEQRRIEGDAQAASDASVEAPPEPRHRSSPWRPER